MAFDKHAIVLAGGLGTRLRSAVPDLPKVLAPVHGRPWLYWLLCALAQRGFVRVVLAIGYRGDAVREAIGASIVSGGRHLTVLYSTEDTPLGTGGALVRAQALLPDAPVFALNGDTWVDLDWDAMLTHHLQTQALLSIAAREVPDRSRFGAIHAPHARVERFGEKAQSGPGLVNAGVYLLAADLFARCPPPGVSFSLESDYIAAHLETLAPAAFVTTAAFLDMGIPSDYQRAPDFVLQALARLPHPELP